MALHASPGFSINSAISSREVFSRAHFKPGTPDADKAFEQGTVDVSSMEKLLDSLLAKQLYAAYESATNG